MSLLPPRGPRKPKVKPPEPAQYKPLNTYALYHDYTGRIILGLDEDVPKNCVLIELIEAYDWQDARDAQAHRFTYKEGYGFFKGVE